MTLLLLQEPQKPSAKYAGELATGTWFINRDDKICLVVLDLRSNERRVICLSPSETPYVSKDSVHSFFVKKILVQGSVLMVTNKDQQGGK